MNAEKITRRSKSNLALAFVSLGKERRADITVFYAFCRLIDDIADAKDLTREEKSAALKVWRRALVVAEPDEPALASDVRRLLAKYPLRPAMLEEIIAGVEMDLTVSRYATWEDLRTYCYRVASAVGLVSIEIFGYRNPACRDYAINLGLALQTTNIIRDVGKDLRLDRVYLPQEDLARFGYGEGELRAGKRNRTFLELMKFEAARARGFFHAAAEQLPPEDRRSMRPAEMMSSIYRRLLDKIERDDFQVFTREYRLTRLEKMVRVGAEWLKFD